jgi:type IV pilus assembly protein PilB
MQNAITLNGILSKLLSKKLISEDVARTAQVKLTTQGVNFASFLITENHIDSLRFAQECAIEFSLPFLDLDTIKLKDMPEVVNHQMIETYSILPIGVEDGTFYLATSNPLQDEALKAISFKSKHPPSLVIVEHNKLIQEINTLLNIMPDSFGDLDYDDLEDFNIESDPEEQEVTLTDISSDESPVVKYINKLLIDAVRIKASDVHFEPYEKRVRVRFRVDGILIEQGSIPATQSSTVSARLKVIADLNIAERRVPQDGRVKIRISKTKSVDFRVSTLPTVFGEKVVMRIMDSDVAKFGADELGMLGYTETQKELFLDALSKPQGLVLVTGPTGSGKSVSLYTGLNILNNEGVNIATAEDPVEINVDGINQVAINNKTGLTFSKALRSFLRQDPDIIMVGEIRDLETAEISIKAAQTGHLVMSTLHTNSAAETLSRLAQMGVPLFNVATSIHMIIAQRLARKLCNKCKKQISVPKDIFTKEGCIIDEESVPIYQANGCNDCRRGYKGRIGIYEVVKISEELSSMIIENKNTLELALQLKKEGYDTLRKSGLNKVLDGTTSLEEIYRVTTE